MNPFEFSADKHGAFTCLWFSLCPAPVCLCSFLNCFSKKTVAPLLQSTQRRRNISFSLYLFLFSFLWQLSQFMACRACAFHPVTDKLHRALATVQRCWSSWTPPLLCFPHWTVLTEGMGLLDVSVDVVNTGYQLQRVMPTPGTDVWRDATAANRELGSRLWTWTLNKDY